MKRRITITIDPDWKERLRKAGRTAEKGIKSGAYQGETLNFSTDELFFKQLSALRLAALRQVQRLDFIGVRELARQLGRDVRRVHDDVGALIELGLLEKTDKGAVHCPYSRIDLEMALVAPTSPALRAA